MALYCLSNHQTPTRPALPRAEDQRRSEYQLARFLMLDEEHADIVKEWMRCYVQDEVLEGWGEPDLAYDLIASYAHQLTTPGRYWQTPKCMGEDGSEGVIGTDGAMMKGGYWTKMQRVEYYTVGIGDYFVHVSVNPEGKAIYRPVEPHNLTIQWDPDDPDKIVALLELRIRWSELEAKWRWAWDVYDLSDPANPSMRVLAADEVVVDENGQHVYADLSSQFVVHPDGVTYGAMTGAAYPYRDPETDELVIPYVHHRGADMVGWNLAENNGLHRATLHATTYATYTGRCALDATGEFAIYYGLEVGADMRPGEMGSPSSAGPPVRQIPIRPGMLLHGTVVGDKVGKLDFGASVNLPHLSAFLRGYMMDALKLRGLGASDVQKQAANPTSGAALHISNKEREEASEKRTPLFRKADEWAMRLTAILLNAFTGSTYPTSGYTLVYAQPRKSPQEEASQREGQSWAMSEGLKSRVDVVLEHNPGMTREAAIAMLARVQADEVAVNEAASALGIETEFESEEEE